MATWKQFQEASWEVGAGDFEDIADHWNDYKDMHAGRGITLYGDIWKPHSDLEWEYEFMGLGTSPMILKELGESPPEPLPMPNRDKLIARWPKHISYDRHEDGTPVDKPPGYKKWTLEDVKKYSKNPGNPGNPGKEPMLKSEITNLEFYKEPKMMGDHWAIKLVDHYFDQREKILGYKGASAVDRDALAFYESLLIAPTRGFWWHNTDRKHLDTILWLLRRLKVGMTREQEKDLFADFYRKLAYYRRFFLGTKDVMEALDKRWGTAGKVLPVLIDTTQFEFGSVAWQDAMIHNISSKIKAGMPLDGYERTFIPVQLEHNLRLKVKRGTPLTEEEKIIWDWLERKGEISPKTETETMETLVVSLHDRKIQVTLQTALELIKELEKPTLPFPHIRRLIQDLEIDIEDLTDLGYIGSHPEGKYRLSPDDFRMLCQIKQEAQRLGDQPRERDYCENLKVLAQDRVYALIGEISKVGHYVTEIEPHETGSTLVQKCYVQPGEPYAVGYRCPRYIAEKIDKLKTDVRIIKEDCPQYEVTRISPKTAEEINLSIDQSIQPRESAKERGRKALEHMGKASWSVNEVEENLTEAYALIEGLPEFSKAFSELQYANASWYPDKIDSHLGRAEEILEETLKTVSGNPITPEEFKDLPFEKKMDIAEKADRGEATEEELTALKKWLREPGFMEAVRINRNIDAKVGNEHWQKYEYWAQKIGIPHLIDLVPFTKEQIIEALRTDEHLNNLPLEQWDAQDVHITRMARDRGFPAWSLANSVRLLKHVAKYHIVSDIERPETVEVEREPWVPPEREEPYETIRECLEEAKADIMGRCANIPRHYLKDCVQVHEGALEEVRMLILNDQDLYNKGPYSRKWPKVRDDIIEYAYDHCESAFKPNAEEEIEELRKPTGDKAKDIANYLWIPYLEQFVEIPREERISLTDECKRTLKFSVQDMETCLKDKWPEIQWPQGKEAEEINRRIDAKIQGKAIILNLDDIRDTTKGFHEDVFRRIRESKAVRELGKVMAEQKLDIMDDEDLMTFLNSFPMPPEWGAIIRPDGDFAKLSGTIGGEPLAIYWDIGNQIGVMHYHPWEITYGEGVTFKEFVPYPKLSGEDIPDILACIRTHGIENFRYEAVFTDDKITIYDLGNYTPDKWEEIGEHALKKVKEYPGLEMELSMLKYGEVEPHLVFIFHVARDLGYIDWRTIPLKGKVNLEELFLEGRLVSAVSADNKRVCGEPCPKHPGCGCHVACLPDELYKELKFKSALPVTDCRDPHIHSHLLPTKDGRLLAHRWGKGIDKYVAADSPKETSLKPITEKEARELVKENVDWRGFSVTEGLSVADSEDPHEPIPVYRVSLDTPKGQMNVDVPTAQGPDAAARRALWSIVAKFGFEPDEVTVMASTPVEVDEERENPVDKIWNAMDLSDRENVLLVSDVDPEKAKELRNLTWAQVEAELSFTPETFSKVKGLIVDYFMKTSNPDEKWRPVIVLSEQGTPVTMMVPARIPTELEADIYEGIFDKIKNPEHWKLPTEPVYTEDRTNAQVIRDAIEYFHGGGEITQLDDKFKVWSKGYFFYVGGKLHVGISGKGKEKIEVCLDCTRKHLLAARALLKEVLEGTRKSGYPTMRERLKVEEIEEQIQEVEKHPLRGEAPSEEVKKKLLDLHDKAYKTRKKLEGTKIGYPHEEIRVHGDIRDIEEVLERVEEMLGDTYEMIAMGETAMERIEVSFKEENRVRPAHDPPTARLQPLTVNASCATCCDHDGVCSIDNLDGWNGEHLARIMPALREITAPAVTELHKLNKHFGTNVDIRFWSLDDLKKAGLKTNYMGFVAHSNPSTMFLLPENIYNPLDSVRTVRHEFQHSLDLSGGCPLCTSHQRERRAREFEAVTFPPIAGLQRTEKVAELVVTPYSKLMKKTKDQIFQTLKETHPNADYDFWIRGGTIGYRGAATTIKELVDMGIDGISIALRDATITWNADRGYVIHAVREDIFAGKVKEQGGEAINAMIDAQIAETPPVRFVKKMRIPETEETEKLYQCEKRRNDLIKQCAREWMKVTGTPKEEFWTVAVPTALHDVLDSFETSSSRIAAETFLKINARIDAQVDAQPIRVHAPTIITSLLNQTANILQIAAEKLPEETIYFPPKEAGEKQPIKLEGRVSLEDIAGLTKYLADMLAVSGRIDPQVTWEERSKAWEEEFQKAPFLFMRDRDERIKWVIGILSDVQEVIQREDFETANEWLNKAKYHLIKLGKVEGRELITVPQRKLSAVLPDYESDAVMEMEELRRDFELGRIPDFSFDQEKARVEGKMDVILDLMALAQKGKIAGKQVSAREINAMVDAQLEEYPLKEEKKKVATNIIRHSSEGKPFGSTQMILTSGVLTTIGRDEVDHMWDDYHADPAAIVEYRVNDRRVWVIDDGMVLTMLFPSEY